MRTYGGRLCIRFNLLFIFSYECFHKLSLYRTFYQRQWLWCALSSSTTALHPLVSADGSGTIPQGPNMA